MSRGDRLIRLLNMFFVIQASPGLSAPELAARCQVSERQCYRDLRTLQDAGIPIYYDNGYRVVDCFVLKNISLTLDEALSLIYGIKLIERQQGVFSVTGIKEKLLSLLPEKLRGEIEEIEDKMEIQIKPGVDYSKKEELFRRLNGAVRENKQLHMEYASLSSKERTTRIIEPYRLVFKDKFWYIVAYCHRRREVRLFRIDRIKKLEETGGHFIPPADFDFETYMGSAWQMERGEEFSFQVRFTGNSARYVRETQFHPSQKITENKDGSILFSAKASGLRSILRWVLSFGSEAEILAPPDFRRMVAGELAEWVKRYK